MKGKVNYILFAVFAIILFVKCLLFQWDAFHCMWFDASVNDMLSICTFYADQLLAAILVSCFLLVSKHRWWTIVLCIIEDIWNIANLIYYKTYNAFLAVEDILLVGNMDGAWSSVTAYFDVWMVFMVLSTLLWYALCCIFRKQDSERHWLAFGITTAIVIILEVANIHVMYAVRDRIEANAIILDHTQADEDDWGHLVDTDRGISGVKSIPGVKSAARYLREHTMLLDWLNVYYRIKNSNEHESVTLNEKEIQSIEAHIHASSECPTPANHLIIILVESLESWPIEQSVDGQVIAPFMQSLRDHEHVLYCSKIKDQTAGGNSGDGQMIVNTGLLPVQKGVACMHYGNSTYPNIAHFYTNSVLVNPWPHIWNQDTMSMRYGYMLRLEPDGEDWQDEQVMQHAMDYLKTETEPTCICILTVSTHSPFNRVTNNAIQTSAPTVLNRYMQCLNYTDRCVGDFIEEMQNDPQLSQSTIIITGDHTIFKPAMLREFADYAKSQNLSIATGETYCPLFVYSPRINGNVQIDEVCYQMDIYPTILHLIGCDGYYWHGFGCNMLDTTERNNKHIQESEARRLSDLIIRSDFFGQY